jgi:hypothetical protein
MRSPWRAVASPAGQLGVQVGQVALQHRRLMSASAVTPMASQNTAKRVSASSPRLATGKPNPVPNRQTQPLFDQVAQPRLRDPGEGQPLVTVEPEPPHLPQVAAELGLPAAGVGEVLHPAAGVDQHRAPLSLLRGATATVCCAATQSSCRSPNALPDPHPGVVKTAGRS